MDSSYRVEVETSIGPLTGLFSCPLCLGFFLCIACAAKPQKLAAIKNPPAMLTNCATNFSNERKNFARQKICFSKSRQKAENWKNSCRKF